jgi:hypothetical protein
MLPFVYLLSTGRGITKTKSYISSTILTENILEALSFISISVESIKSNRNPVELDTRLRETNMKEAAL